MGMWVPEEVRNLFLVLTGEQWPDVDEDALRRLGDSWDHAAGRIESELTPLVNTAVSGIRAEFSGDAELGFASSMAAFTTEPPFYFDTGTKHYRTMGKFGRDTATMVNYVKVMIIGQLVVLAVEIAVYTALAGPTFGASLRVLAARFTIVRLLINTLLGRLLLRIALAQLVGVGLQVALDAIVQRIQLDTGWRDKWDPSLTRQAAEVGALGGVVGVALGPMSGLVGRGLGKVLGSMTAQRVGRIGGELAEEGLAESLTEMFYTASQGGGWKFNPFAFTAGMAEGTAALAGKQLGRLIFPRSGTAVGPNVPLSDVLEAHDVPATLDTVESIRTGSDSPATKVLERYGIPTGPGTAYAIAASAGLVPATGDMPLPAFTARGLAVPEAVRSWFPSAEPAGTATVPREQGAVPAVRTVSGEPVPSGLAPTPGHSSVGASTDPAEPGIIWPSPNVPPGHDAGGVVAGSPSGGPEMAGHGTQLNQRPPEVAESPVVAARPSALATPTVESPAAPPLAGDGQRPGIAQVLAGVPDTSPPTRQHDDAAGGPVPARPTPGQGSPMDAGTVPAARWLSDTLTGHLLDLDQAAAWVFGRPGTSDGRGRLVALADKVRAELAAGGHPQDGRSVVERRPSDHPSVVEARRIAGSNVWGDLLFSLDPSGAARVDQILQQIAHVLDQHGEPAARLAALVLLPAADRLRVRAGSSNDTNSEASDTETLEPVTSGRSTPDQRPHSADQQQSTEYEQIMALLDATDSESDDGGSVSGASAVMSPDVRDQGQRPGGRDQALEEGFAQIYGVLDATDSESDDGSRVSEAASAAAPQIVVRPPTPVQQPPSLTDTIVGILERNPRLDDVLVVTIGGRPPEYDDAGAVHLLATVLDHPGRLPDHADADGLDDWLAGAIGGLPSFRAPPTDASGAAAREADVQRVHERVGELLNRPAGSATTRAAARGLLTVMGTRHMWEVLDTSDIASLLRIGEQYDRWRVMGGPRPESPGEARLVLTMFDGADQEATLLMPSGFRQLLSDFGEAWFAPDPTPEQLRAYAADRLAVPPGTAGVVRTLAVRIAMGWILADQSAEAHQAVSDVELYHLAAAVLAGGHIGTAESLLLQPLNQLERDQIIYVIRATRDVAAALGITDHGVSSLRAVYEIAVWARDPGSTGPDGDAAIDHDAPLFDAGAIADLAETVLGGRDTAELLDLHARARPLDPGGLGTVGRATANRLAAFAAVEAAVRFWGRLARPPLPSEVWEYVSELSLFDLYQHVRSQHPDDSGAVDQAMAYRLAAFPTLDDAAPVRGPHDDLSLAAEVLRLVDGARRRAAPRPGALGRLLFELERTPPNDRLTRLGAAPPRYEDPPPYAPSSPSDPDASVATPVTGPEDPNTAYGQGPLAAETLARHRLAAEGGDVDAMNELGVLLERQGDAEGAEYWWRRAATARHAGGMSHLGVLLARQGNTAEALSWHRLAAEGGDAEAMNDLGALVEERGDTASAWYWYRRAAADGHAGAIYNLGSLLAEQGDTGGALGWYCLAAEAGDAGAMRQLGVLLHGLGDFVGAAHWSGRAAEADHTDAADALRH